MKNDVLKCSMSKRRILSLSENARLLRKFSQAEVNIYFPDAMTRNVEASSCYGFYDLTLLLS